MLCMPTFADFSSDDVFCFVAIDSLPFFMCPIHISNQNEECVASVHVIPPNSFPPMSCYYF
jgi:hypothetical protein